MSQSSVGMELPLKVTGGDGTVLWLGVGMLGVCRAIKNTEATSQIGEAMHVILDTANSIFMASNSAATATAVATVMAGKIGSTTPPSSLGFALGAIDAGATGEVAAAGSICLARTASATGTIGQHILGGAAGVVTNSATPPSAAAVSPGYTLKPSGTTGGATDTGTATRILVQVSVHSI